MRKSLWLLLFREADDSPAEIHIESQVDYHQGYKFSHVTESNNKFNQGHEYFSTGVHYEKPEVALGQTNWEGLR